MAELGTIYCNPDIVNNHFNSPTIGVGTSFGRIQASIAGDAGIYDEIAIDLIAPDGRTMQLAVIGVTENSAGTEVWGEGDPNMHAYVWNGTEEFCTWDHNVTVSDESYWY